MLYEELENIRLNWKGKICLFGAGKIGKGIGYDVISASGLHIDFYYDNNLAEEETIRDNKKTIGWKQLCSEKDSIFVFITVGVKYQSEIVRQLEAAEIRHYLPLDFSVTDFYGELLDSKDTEAMQRYDAIVGDEIVLKKQFQKNFGYQLNLENPKTFNEKIQWRKMYDRRREYVELSDKYEFKKYVESVFGKKYVIPNIKVYDRVEEIDWEKLPQQFVIKCSHDSGSVVVCRDKNDFDIEIAIDRLENALKRNFYVPFREWQYKDIPRKIIAEEYLDNGTEGLVDYKFYCFSGEPKFLYVSGGLDNHALARISYLTLDWQFAPFKRPDYEAYEQLPPKPSKYDEMLRIAKTLSKGFSFVRVDLYEVKGQVYCSELTFTPGAGYTPFEPAEYDRIVGDMWKIND